MPIPGQGAVVAERHHAVRRQLCIQLDGQHPYAVNVLQMAQHTEGKCAWATSCVVSGQRRLSSDQAPDWSACGGAAGEPDSTVAALS